MLLFLVRPLTYLTPAPPPTIKFSFLLLVSILLAPFFFLPPPSTLFFPSPHRITSDSWCVTPPLSTPPTNCVFSPTHLSLFSTPKKTTTTSNNKKNTHTPPLFELSINPTNLSPSSFHQPTPFPPHPPYFSHLVLARKLYHLLPSLLSSFLPSPIFLWVLTMPTKNGERERV